MDKEAFKSKVNAVYTHFQTEKILAKLKKPCLFEDKKKNLATCFHNSVKEKYDN